jgi:hypothetical protein
MKGTATFGLVRLRVPIMAAMVCIEIAGLVHYRATELFLSFLSLSILCTAATAALLWLDVFGPMGLSPGIVAYCLLLLTTTDTHAYRKSKAEIAVDLAFDSLILAFALLYVFANRQKKSRSLKGLPPEANEQKSDSVSLGPLGSLILASSLLFEASDPILFGDHSLLWLAPVLPPLGCFAWLYVLHRKQQKQLNPTENLSILQ